MAAAIPQMVMQGQDPMKIVEKMASVITDRKKGISLEDAVANAFKPEPVPEAPPGQPGMQEQPPAPGPGMPQGRPPMQELLAGLTGGGNPNLAARVTRQIPA